MMPGVMLFVAIGLIALFGLGFVLFIAANAGRGRNDWFPPDVTSHDHAIREPTHVGHHAPQSEKEGAEESSDMSDGSDSGSDYSDAGAGDFGGDFGGDGGGDGGGGGD